MRAQLKRLILVSLLVAGVAAFTAAEARARQPLPHSGTLYLRFISVAVGLGFTKGDGWLYFRGQQYPVKVEGLNLVGVGYAEVTARGEVYNLREPADIIGTYWEAGGDAALIKGVRGSLAKNERGVVIDMSATQKGVSLSMGGGGFKISMKYR